MPREKQHTLKLNESDKKRIERIAIREKKPMAFIAGYLFEMCEKYDIAHKRLKICPFRQKDRLFNIQTTFAEY